MVLEFRTQFLMDCLQRIEETEGTWVALKGSKSSKTNRFLFNVSV